jgi:hypothetical protein
MGKMPMLLAPMGKMPMLLREGRNDGKGVLSQLYLLLLGLVPGDAEPSREAIAPADVRKPARGAGRDATDAHRESVPELSAQAYVDAADYEWLSRYGWQVYAGGYAARHEKGKVIFMHREIMQPPEGMVVDHIDSNKGNNCRLNLRVCTPAENCHNRVKRAHSTSRFLGVSYNKRLDKYSARLHYNGKAIFIGYFDGEVEAARAYDHKAVECCGRFARVNLPEEWPPERIQQVYADAQAQREALPAEAAQAKTRKGTGKKASAKGQKQKTKGKNKKSDAKRTTQPARRVSAGRRTRVARRQTKSRRPGRKT